MYSGFLKGMSGGKGGSAKEQKSHQKQSNRNSNASDTSLPNEEFIDLKNTLVQFKKTLKHFSRVIFHASTCSQSSGIKRIHVGLGEVLDNLKIILEKYPAVASPEVFASVQMLINYVQSRQNTRTCVIEGDRLINQLALYFTKSASQYVLQMRDLKNSDKIQGLKALKNSSSIFGIELEKHLNASKSDVPFVVTKCIKEVEAHGLYLKGIYRVSAVKSKVHQLCEAFEKHGNNVSLTDINPNIIANVLKLYLRELPQPLFTFELYPEFIRVAKLYEADSSDKNKIHCIDELRKILSKLPKPYYAAASTVMQHLHRISNESTVNNMSAYNLAVIFGPTLLHCLKDTYESTPGAALFDSIHQIRAIEHIVIGASMRELRKDVESTLESPKEELVDNIDEMKIEEVLMGLKGLKQEEVFSFLGKNNFTPAETEMTSAGFGNYDQLAGVDSADIEQLQLNFDGNFDSFQGPNGHVMPNGSLIHKTTSLAKIADTKMKLRPDTVPMQKSIYQSVADGFCDWSARKERAEANATIKLPSLDFRRTSAIWPKCPAAPVTYSLADGYLENLREEEIVSTPMNEVPSVVDSGNLNDEFKYPVNNTYVIQSSDATEPVEVADKPKPIKLLIKRVENEDEVSTTNLEEAANDNVRAKSKRIRNPCTKRKFIETSPPPKKKRCTKKPVVGKPKDKSESPSISKKKNEPVEEFEFPFATTVHQDDDFVYPSLDMSDDEEEDVYSFSQRDDETWTPKIKMKINEVKTSRPTRDRKTKSAVAKCLEAAAMKRADSDSMNESSRRKKCAKKHPKKKLPPTSTIHKKPNAFIPSSTDSILSIDSDVTGDLIIDDSVTSSSRDYAFNNLNPEYNVPSTSSTVHSTSSSSYNLLTDSAHTSPESSPIKPKLTKKGRPCQKSPRAKNKTRLVPPKTCKLIQTPPATSSSTSTPTTTPVPKRMKNDSMCSPSSSSCADKKNATSYVTKRGKPKKGMATAKQRLGKILKMHKMFF